MILHEVLKASGQLPKFIPLHCRICQRPVGPIAEFEVNHKHCIPLAYKTVQYIY